MTETADERADRLARVADELLAERYAPGRLPSVKPAEHPGVVRERRNRLAEVDGVQPCGTFAAYRRHLAHGELPCQPCVAAQRQRERERKRRRKAVS